MKELPAPLRGADAAPETANPGRVVGIIMPFGVVTDRIPLARRIARTIVDQLEPADLGMIIFPGQTATWTAMAGKADLLKQIDSPLCPLAPGEEGNRGRDFCETAMLDAMSAFAEIRA